MVGKHRTSPGDSYPSHETTRTNSRQPPLKSTSAVLTTPNSNDVEKGTGDPATSQELPLPAQGYHAVGVVFENATVYGSSLSKRGVQSFEYSVLRSFHLYGWLENLFGIKTGPSRAIISRFPRWSKYKVEANCTRWYSWCLLSRTESSRSW
jgi:hypothetical protein